MLVSQSEVVNSAVKHKTDFNILIFCLHKMYISKKGLPDLRFKDYLQVCLKVSTLKIQSLTSTILILTSKSVERS